MSALRPLLVVDDDENDIFLIKRAFRDAGIENPLFTASDGQEAIEYLSGMGQFADRAKFPVPYLIILDLKMPRKTGVEVLQWLRHFPRLRFLPVIMFSSSAHPGDVEASYEEGANAFVVKPVGVGKRMEFVKAIRDFWLAFNEPVSGGSSFSMLI